MTRSLTVEYLRPVLLHTDYEFTARARQRSGRRLLVEAEAIDQAGATIATADATFVTVDLRHFQQSRS